MIRFLNSNIRYPIQTAENKLEGRVVVRFVVTRDGKGLDSFSEQEAIRLVKSMPKWIPARVNGRSIPFSLILPIMFKLEK